jgi:hypothetical protein
MSLIHDLVSDLDAAHNQMCVKMTAKKIPYRKIIDSVLTWPDWTCSNPDPEFIGTSVDGTWCVEVSADEIKIKQEIREGIWVQQLITRADDEYTVDTIRRYAFQMTRTEPNWSELP